MAEYISKDQLHEITKPFKDSFLSFLTDEVDRLVDTIEPADVQPVKHGKWMGSVCSACGENTSYYYDCSYCPNCGAKMDG